MVLNAPLYIFDLERSTFYERTESSSNARVPAIKHIFKVIDENDRLTSSTFCCICPKLTIWS